jgi:hypothetical protein
VTGYIVASTGQFDAAFTIAGMLLALGAVVAFALTRESIGGEVGAGKTAPMGRISEA